MAVAIRPMDLDAAEFRRAAAQLRDAQGARRILVLAFVLDEHSRTDAAELCGMDRQTLRGRLHCYNDFGLSSLLDRVPPGSKLRLSPDQEAEVMKMVYEGPALSEQGVVRWHRIDLSRVIEARFGVHLAERSVGDMLYHL